MIKNQIIFLYKRILIITAGALFTLALQAQQPETALRVDGAVRYQTLDGFGVNINAAWWYNGEYRDAAVVQPAIDLLIDSLGATIFRAVIEEIDWEAVNDDNDPGHFNWTYYNKVFSDSRFQGVWKTLRYLNHKGITDGLMISFMGAPPAAAPMAAPDPKKSWMGGLGFTIDPSREDELAESIAALLYYMRNTAGIKFRLVSPMNETDIVSMTRSKEHPYGQVEGPNIDDAVQYVRIVKKLARKLDSVGMSDIRFVAPDAGGDVLFRAFLNEMVKDPYLMGKLACWGVHQYGNDAGNYRDIINIPQNPNKSFWVTETAGIGNMLGQLDDDAGAYIFWDGFDCVYQHGRRNGFGDVPPNDWAFWFKSDEGKPLIEYMAQEKTWKPRKHFYEHEQIMRYVRPGAVRIGATGQDSSLQVLAFRNPGGQLVILGRNKSKQTLVADGTLANLPGIKNLEMTFTGSTENFSRGNDINLSGESFKASIPAECIFTIYSSSDAPGATVNNLKPEPANWYAGDIHVHRNCGEVTPITPETELTTMMEPNDLAVISVLADMGNGEVKDSREDLPKVNGLDSKYSKPGRLVHYDAEWHFDPEGVTFEHKALGGHLVLLGLKEAHQIWDESVYKILGWGRAQGAVVGFCHMEYLNDKIQKELTCCIPVDYPVEAALGTIDFLSEDVWLNDAAINGYYKILNCGFRVGWAAGTDFPCNESRPLGSLLTYVKVNDGPLTYRKWIDGIRNGRTVVTTDGHSEFLDLKVNGSAGPGDEIRLDRGQPLSIDVDWTSVKDLTGKIEIVCNGNVVASQEATARPGHPVYMNTSLNVGESSWICARRMAEAGHQSHTSPVYITVGNKPVRASTEDARYFVNWIDNILTGIAPGGPWAKYFTHDQETVRKRYQQARSVYEKIAVEAAQSNKLQAHQQF